MEQYAWIFWLALGIVLVIAEMFTFGFVLFWFGIGAFAAALAAFLGVGLLGQFVVFAVLSIALTVMSRTIFSRYISHGDDSVKFGVDALPGKIGTVTEESSGALNEAAVKVFGSTWTAFPVDGEEMLMVGEKVEVVSVKGSSIYVRAVRAKELNSPPDWRSGE